VWVGWRDASIFKGKTIINRRRDTDVGASARLRILIWMWGIVLVESKGRDIVPGLTSSIDISKIMKERTIHAFQFDGKQGRQC